MVGAELPVDPIRRQIVTTGRTQLGQTVFSPMVVDVSSGLYHHKESKGLLFGWAKPGVEASFDISVDPEYTDEILERAMIRVKDELLDEIEVANQWAGLYETTPDHHAVIGWEPRVDGLFLLHRILGTRLHARPGGRAGDSRGAHRQEAIGGHLSSGAGAVCSRSGGGRNKRHLRQYTYQL